MSTSFSVRLGAATVRDFGLTAGGVAANLANVTAVTATLIRPDGARIVRTTITVPNSASNVIRWTIPSGDFGSGLIDRIGTYLVIFTTTEGVGTNPLEYPEDEPLILNVTAKVTP